MIFFFKPLKKSTETKKEKSLRELQLGESSNVGGLDIVLEGLDGVLDVIDGNHGVDDVAGDDQLLDAIANVLELGGLPLETIDGDGADLGLERSEILLGVPGLDVEDDDGLLDDLGLGCVLLGLLGSSELLLALGLGGRGRLVLILVSATEQLDLLLLPLGGGRGGRRDGAGGACLGGEHSALSRVKGSNVTLPPGNVGELAHVSRADLVKGSKVSAGGGVPSGDIAGGGESLVQSSEISHCVHK